MSSHDVLSAKAKLGEKLYRRLQQMNQDLGVAISILGGMGQLELLSQKQEVDPAQPLTATEVLARQGKLTALPGDLIYVPNCKLCGRPLHARFNCEAGDMPNTYVWWCTNGCEPRTHQK